MADSKCKHTDFHIHTDFQFIQDYGENGVLMIEQTIHCKTCKTPFRYKGLQLGISFIGPSTSLGGHNLKIPIEPYPEITPVLDAKKKQLN